MTAAHYAYALLFVAVLLLGWIVLEMRAGDALAKEAQRLTEPLPPERLSLLPALETTRTDWPARLTPTDLQEAYEPRHASELRATLVDHQPCHAPALSWTVDSGALRALLEAERTYADVR